MPQALSTADEAPEPDIDPSVAPEIESARVVFAQLLRGIKQIGLYRHAESKYAEYLEKAHAALAEHHRQYGALELRIEQTHFSVMRAPLPGDDTALPYKFFKDGIRQIIFQPGFTLAELVRFTLIALSDPERGADDLNAQFWQEQLPHFEYIMIEGFRLDEFEEEQVRVEVESVVEYLEQRLRANSVDTLRFARINEQDLEMTLEGVDQMRGLVIKGITAGAALKARAQKEILEEESTRQFPKLVAALFQIIHSGIDDVDLLQDLLTHLLDAMVMQDDFGTINQVVHKLKGALQNNPHDALLEQLLSGFLQHMGEEARLSRITETLKRLRPKNAIDVARYISALPPNAVVPLLGVLEQVELADNRLWLCELLVPFAKTQAPPFVERLQSERPQTVRDMLYILDRSGHHDRVRFFATVLTSKNLALRLDVVVMIGKGRSAESRKVLVGCLDDAHPQVRVAAARALAEFDKGATFAELLIRITRDDFAAKSFEERQGFFQALGATGTPGALHHFAGLMGIKPGLFNKQRINEDKVLAIYGLGAMGTPAAFEILKRLQAEPGLTPEIASAIRVSMSRFSKTAKEP